MLDPNLIAALGLAGTAGLSIVSSTLAVKLAAARRDVNKLLKCYAEFEKAIEILGHAAGAAEERIRIQGRGIGEHRAKAHAVRQGALRASQASAAACKAKANGATAKA